MTEQQTSAGASRTYRQKYKRIGVGRSRGELGIAILDAVRKVLRNGSYDTLSMEEVAAAASTTRRTLYNLFLDKDDLYRNSCERLLKEVAEAVTDEIPENMNPNDGMRYFISSCLEIYSTEAAADLLLTLVRDGSQHPWLVQAYNKDVHDRLVRACENYILKQCRHAPLAPGAPRYIGEQVVGSIKSLNTGPLIFGQTNLSPPHTNARIEILANAYSSLMSSHLIGKSI
jgi:AcrR family transcriptional regulator